MFKFGRAQSCTNLLAGPMVVGLLSLGSLLSGCVDADENANLARYDGSWTVVTVNGAAPMWSYAWVKIESPSLYVDVGCNSLYAYGTLRDNRHFVQNSGEQTLRGCSDRFIVLDSQVVELLGSHPLFTDHADGTLTIEAAPYSLVLRRQ